MFIYNKIDDLYHTGLRMLAHIEGLGGSSEAKRLLIVDFLYCYPQYFHALATAKKRKFKDFVNYANGSNYKGEKSSHLFMLERSHVGAMMLLHSKGIIEIANDKIFIKAGFSDLSTVLKVDDVFSKFYKIIKDDGWEVVNDILQLLEAKYEVVVKD